jgi:hypothetical protein
MEKTSFFPIFTFSLIILVSSMFVSSEDTFNATTIMEVNLLGFSSGGISPEVGIEVPDYLFLGNLSKVDPLSEEKAIYMNNTGKKDITVTPVLKDPTDEVFRQLFFRLQKSTSGEDKSVIEFKRIGEFSLDIDKPATGKVKRAGHCYTQLNLTGFENIIEEDVIAYRSEIIFIAMAR